jgi:hypothetical protein
MDQGRMIQAVLPDNCRDFFGKLVVAGHQIQDLLPGYRIGLMVIRVGPTPRTCPPTQVH